MSDVIPVRGAVKYLEKIAVQPIAKEREISDGTILQLRLTLRPSGSHSWCLRYRSPTQTGKDGRGLNRKLVLGPLDKESKRDGDSQPVIGMPLSLAEARELARTQLTIVKRGDDPADLRKHVRVERQSGAFTLKARVDEFMQAKKDKGLRQKTTDEYQRIFDNIVLKHWQETLDVRTIKSGHVVTLLDKIKRPQMRRSTFTLLKIFFRWLFGKDIIEHMPVKKSQIEDVKKAKKRDRYFNDHEINLFWQATETLEYPAKQCARLLLLTGCRRKEIIELHRSEVDLTKNRPNIELPPERTKNHLRHLVPISAMAVGEVRTALKHSKSKRLVLTYTGKTPFSAGSNTYKAIHTKMVELNKNKPIPHWSWHNLRHTVSTRLSQLKIEPHIIEALLNHISGAKAGVAGVYNHYMYEDEKREALEKWEKHIDNVVKKCSLALDHGRQQPVTV